ncbi:MAG: leucine-rich repeat protein [Spirochaetales bacterium]|nr:leucine-rich repeat protein [Candidatus Physcosoma equi]
MTRRVPYILLVLSLLVAGMSLLASCTRRNVVENENSWVLPSGLKASMEDDGNHGFVLTMTGNGAIGDYADKGDAPWYSKSGRISSIVLGEGITSIGANAFAAVTHVEEVMLPRTVTKIGSNAFQKETRVFGYGPIENLSEAKVYLYSENQPTGDGDWWRTVDGKAQVWENIRILFVGNSFTYYNDIDKLVEQIAAGAGMTVKTDRIAIGSHNLSQFADPKDEGGKVVEELLTSERKYSFVILQEQSTRPLTGFSLFRDGSEKLMKRVSETQSGAKVFLYATWGYPGAQSGMTVPETEKKLRDAYFSVASELGAGVSPVGEAFTTLYETHPEINLYAGDQKHPSYEGSFLSACVHVATLLAIDPRESSFEGQLSPEQAKVLKEVAYETVFKKNK